MYQSKDQLLFELTEIPKDSCRKPRTFCAYKLANQDLIFAYIGTASAYEGMQLTAAETHALGGELMRLAERVNALCRLLDTAEGGKDASTPAT